MAKYTVGKNDTNMTFEQQDPSVVNGRPVIYGGTDNPEMTYEKINARLTLPPGAGANGPGTSLHQLLEDALNKFRADNPSLTDDELLDKFILKELEDKLNLRDALIQEFEDKLRLRDERMKSNRGQTGANPSATHGKSKTPTNG